jgi:hypothetical protein
MIIAVAIVLLFLTSSSSPFPPPLRDYIVIFRSKTLRTYSRTNEAIERIKRQHTAQKTPAGKLSSSVNILIPKTVRNSVRARVGE